MQTGRPDLDTADPIRLVGKCRGVPEQWAATGYSLEDHLIDTAAFGVGLLRAGIAPDLPWLPLLAGWHDIGKATLEFQRKLPVCPPELAGPRPISEKGHARWSGVIVAERLTGEHSNNAALVLAGHHGRIPTELPEAADLEHLERGLGSRLDEERTRVLDLLERLVGGVPAAALERRRSAVVAGWVVLADWLASQEQFIERRLADMVDSPDARFDQALGAASATLRDLRLSFPEQPKRIVAAGFSSVFPTIAGPSSLQASLMESFEPAGPGIIVITAPTGEGKTEAAFIAAAALGEAAGREGLFWAMPTMGTADGLADRFDAFAATTRGRGGRVIHSLTGITRPVTEDPAPAEQWFGTSSRRNLLAPMAIGTIDQALLAVVATRFTQLRLAALSNKVLVIDEAHTVDPYMAALTLRLLEWCGALEIPVVLLSATMPNRLAAEFLTAYIAGARGDPNPAPELEFPGWVSWDKANGFRAAAPDPRRRWALQIERHPTPADELPEAIARQVTELSGSAAVLCIVSAVGRCQAVYELLPSDLRSSTTVLHSRLRLGDRQARSEELQHRHGRAAPPAPGRVLIATQVAEVSLDVDFDVLVTDVAPVASVLQRAGRIHRHAERERPTLHASPVAHVYYPALADGQPDLTESNALPYHLADLEATLRLLTGPVQIPDDLQHLVDEAQRPTGTDADLDRALQAHTERSQARLVRIAGPHEEGILDDLTSPADPDTFNPRTRLAVDSHRVLPCWTTPDGLATAPHGPPLNGRSAPSRERQLELLLLSIPVSVTSERWRWVTALDTLGALLPDWEKTPVGDLRLLPMESLTHSQTLGGHRVIIDPELGLRLETTPPCSAST